jgi:hypothetical protein
MADIWENMADIWENLAEILWSILYLGHMGKCIGHMGKWWHMKKYRKNTSRTCGKKWRTYGNRTLLGHMGKYGGHMTATPLNHKFVDNCAVRHNYDQNLWPSTQWFEPWHNYFYLRCHFVQRGSTICFVVLVLVLPVGESLIRSNQKAMLRQSWPPDLIRN